eukprot:CAMPEP_0179431500 /NCGR_PEP_ID=MMETSP0799-20121207/16381_1 /TAXON_ID=46947 /ORGANISM="Geminigera cryophila, Strain CCMP2564" /LENGTH=488 /DNA_ID=CAMNT_0021208475 /DNA_START=192 /DNA_END=1658 /DNA_ORIENTATION=-
MPPKGDIKPKRTQPVNEQILKESARIYDNRELCDEEDDVRMMKGNDLISFAKFLSKEDAFTKGLPKDLLERAKSMRPPRDRITCLLIGNHSAGKSSFTNWYVGEQIQKESVAIETAGITIIRKGSKKTTWKGSMTLETFPHLEALGKIPGVADFLVTEISTSEEKNFPLVEFIDTPGLTDGTLKYPFDVDQVIYELAEHATMIMVFLDPIGKALVSRCMNVVEKMAENHSAKMSYYLTKFDTAGDEVDRTNVVSQIVQELQGRVKATHALKLHTMYLPERASEEVKKTVPNKIEELCRNIRLEIDSRVQDVLDSLSKDCQALTKIVDEKVERNIKCKSHNTMATVWKVVLSLVFAMILSELAVWGLLNHADSDVLGLCEAQLSIDKITSQTLPNGDVIQEVQDKPPNKNAHCSILKLAGGVPVAVGLLVALIVCIVLWITKTKNVEQLSGSEMARLKSIKEEIHKSIAKKHKDLKKRLKDDALEDHLA